MSGVVIAVSGRIASGKTSVSRNVAAKLGWMHAGFGDYIRSIAAYMGYEQPDRRLLQDLGSICARDPRHLCLQALKQRSYRPGESLIIDGIRHIEVYNELKTCVEPASTFLVFIESQEDLLQRRINEREGGVLYEIERHDTERQVLGDLKTHANVCFATIENMTPECLANEIVGWIVQRSTEGNNIER